MAFWKLQAVALMLQAIVWSLSGSNAQFAPADNYLIDCGSETDTVVGSRTFLADTSSTVTLKNSRTVLGNTSFPSIPISDDRQLYQTARIFTGLSSYAFDIKRQGRHFIRLYFFPFAYQSYDLSTAVFTVATQDVVLLKNFQPANKSAAVFKEFSANITRDRLVLSFMPSNGLAFVNAIEVVSVPDDLIVDVAREVNPTGQYLGLSTQLLETAVRLNMGGPKVTADNDTLGRNWWNDRSFIVDTSVARAVSGKVMYVAGLATPVAAPASIYGTATELVASNTSNSSGSSFNVSWQLSLDAGADYLMRFHFCDIVSKSLNLLYFNVYVGGLLAVGNVDLSTLSDSNLAAPLYIDLVLYGKDVAGTLLVSISPSVLPYASPDGILNGLEVMKIMSSSAPGFAVEPASSSISVGVIIGAVVGGVVVAIILVIAFLMVRRRKLEKQQTKTWVPFSINGLTSLSTGSRTSNATTLSGLTGTFGYRFPFAVLQEATNSFDENWVIGVGGFGKVYRGVLRDDTKVAVKRGNPKSQQGMNEFRTEIELLSRLRHRHLVSLIGYCDERNEMILVYEYMEKGTLKSHLYGSELPPLTWKQRLEICIGAARGLHYLHTGQATGIIHRDVKSANILLDECLLAKVADFGLSKTGPELDQTHVSTAVKGSFGYLDPEYYRRQQLTEKSDVYSFGVVLLEVLCARPVIDPTLPREMVNLAEWGMKWQKRGELEQIVDKRIAGTIRPDSLRKFGETAEKCLADYGTDRPAMGDVLWNLEYVLQLQEAEFTDSEVNSMNRIGVELSTQVGRTTRDLESISFVGASSGQNEHAHEHENGDLSDVSMSRVFSQLIKSEGR